MGALSLAGALLLCELLAKADVARYERAALRWLQRFIDAVYAPGRNRTCGKFPPSRAPPRGGCPQADSQTDLGATDG
jgi:hypothetical protein